MAIVRNLMVRAVADFSDLNKKMKDASSKINKFGTELNGGMKGLKGSMMMAQVGANLLTEAIMQLGRMMTQPVKDAMSYEVAFNQVNRTMGKSADQFINWTETVGQSLGFSRLQAMQTGATYSTLFEGFAKSQKENAQMTADMMKATAVVMSTTGRTMDDTFERIRSGILGNTEAIEDLGVSVNATVLENSDAYKQLANGIPWNNLSENIKQQIRYQTILAQITRKYGSEVVDSTATRLRMFQAALGDVRLALGQAFLPILNIALPYLTALAQKIAVVLRYFAAFMRVFFKKGDIKTGAKLLNNQTSAYKNQASAINNTSDAVKNLTKAKKEASRGVAGFDEVNMLNDPSTGDGGGGGGGGGIPPISTPPIDTSSVDDFNNKLQEIDDKVKQYKQDIEDWANKMSEKLKPWKEHWENMKDGIHDVWQGLKDLFDNPFMKDLLSGLWESTVNILTAAWDTLANSLSVVGDTFSLIGDILSGDWKGAWEDTKKLVSDFYDIFMDICIDLLPEFSDQFKQGKQDWIDVFKTLGEQIGKAWDIFKNLSWSDITKAMKDFWNNDIMGWWKTDVVGKFKDILGGTDGVSSPTIVENFKSGWDGIKDWFMNTPVKNVKEAWANINGGTLMTNLKEGWGDIKKWWVENINPKIIDAYNDITGGTMMNNLKTGWGDVKKWFVENVNNKIKDAYNDITGGTLMSNLKGGWGDVAKWFKDNINVKIKAAYDDITGGTLMGYLKSGWGDVKKWFTDNIASKIKSAFSGITSGLGGQISSAFKTVYNKAVGFLNDAIDMINKVGDAIDKTLPGDQIKHIPHIPKLAKGGITGVNSPTLAVVGDNRTQREVVSPLDDLMGMISTAVASAMAVNNGGGGNASSPVNLSIDGRTFARIVKPYLDQESQRIGTNIRLQNI